MEDETEMKGKERRREEKRGVMTGACWEEEGETRGTEEKT